MRPIQIRVGFVLYTCGAGWARRVGKCNADPQCATIMGFKANGASSVQHGPRHKNRCGPRLPWKSEVFSRSTRG